MEQKLINLHREMDKSTIIAINAPLSITDRTSRQKSSKDIEDLYHYYQPT